jgi:hypothetical protein
MLPGMLHQYLFELPIQLLKGFLPHNKTRHLSALLLQELQAPLHRYMQEKERRESK